MNLGLENKVALILASSKGLGLACAKMFFEEGANVIICSRSLKNLEKAEQIIKQNVNKKYDNKVVSIQADLNNKENIEKLIKKTLEYFNRIDILVHNAGGPPSGPIMDISNEEWENAINLNLLSFIRTCYLVIPIMKKQNFGRIIAIASVSVKQPLENMVLSNTTRLGVIGFAKTLANEFAKYNILVNVVCPGPNLTDRMKELIEQSAKNLNKSKEAIMKKWVEQIPLGRLGHPEELASVVTFLASEKASYITGTVIQVDGGFTKSAL